MFPRSVRVALDRGAETAPAAAVGQILTVDVDRKHNAVVASASGRSQGQLALCAICESPTSVQRFPFESCS